ncbi:MAG: pyruvate dehydrogenase (acetyl-transferring) E1 component subunit alpha [Actinomycetota bacterium]|nr:pyruvate dehydrogenase (acetyl-transferring) E1 component subunit alpha [Actinomycetota bacterium]
MATNEKAAGHAHQPGDAALQDAPEPAHEGPDLRSLINPDVDPRELLPNLEPVQLLDRDGVFHEHDDYPLDLKDEDFRRLYRHMVVARRVDQEAINLQRQGQLGVYASCRGQEAAQVGSAYALAEHDWIFPSYRELAAGITRGIDTAATLHMYRGTWLSDHDPHEFNFALMTIPIGTQTLHGVGFAMGARLDDNPIVALIYFGDGATSEGDTNEALNFAGVFQAPCVFFCQNNQYAISVPLSKQTHAPSIAHKGVGFGMPGRRLDGNDVLASYAVTKWAVERARVGEGPTLIEALTYRMEAHTTSDDATRYRTRDELEYWATFDPISRMETFLKRRDLWEDAFADDVEEQARQQSEHVREQIYDAPHPDPLELFEHVYVEPPPHLERQREQLRAELEAAEER